MLNNNVFVDPSFSAADQELLNLEVTPEIENILVQAVMAQSMKEYAQWSKNPIIIDTEFERTFSVLMDLEDELDSILKSIKALKNTNPSDELHQEYVSWINRFNTWKNSPAYWSVSSTERARAWELYKRGLASRKAARDAANGNKREQLSALWDEFFFIRNRRDEVRDSHPGVRAQYFQLVFGEISPYWTNGDTEEVDTSTIWVENNRKDELDFIRDAHLEEMDAENQPESRGPAFWNNRNKTRNEWYTHKGLPKDMQKAVQNSWFEEEMTQAWARVRA